MDFPRGLFVDRAHCGLICTFVAFVLRDSCEIEINIGVTPPVPRPKRSDEVFIESPQKPLDGQNSGLLLGFSRGFYTVSIGF